MQFMSIRSDLCRYVGTPGTLSINFLIWDGGSIYDEGSIRNSVYEGWPMRVSRVIC